MISHVSQTSPGGSHSWDKDRDPGLDFLRALSIVCMTVSHYSYHLPQLTLSARVLQFVFETSAPLFFFSFGMTFDRFFAKGAGFMWERSRRFFYLALCVNLLFHKRLLASDFFWFLWFWQAAVALIEGFFRPLTVLWAIIAAGIAGGLFLFPFTDMSNVFGLGLPGSFPLLPWGGFVLAGIVFSRVGGSTGRDMGISILLMVLGLGFGLAGSLGVWNNFILVRWPMSGPYFLFGTGMVIFLISAVRHWQSIYFSAPGLARGSGYISKNLLTFVALHFVAYLPAGLSLGLFDILGLIRQHPWLNAPAIVLGGVVSMVILVILGRATETLWPVIQGKKILVIARRHFDGVALLLLGLLIVLGKESGGYPTAWTFTLTDTAIWFVLWYFALEIQKSGKPKAGLPD
ncbi:MAG: DUF1624 domain-containing protein [Desulfatibacillum sp.]|nr:DUF1624 domain-containing protein [Desulfatibacillum sp.]